MATCACKTGFSYISGTCVKTPETDEIEELSSKEDDDDSECDNDDDCNHIDNSVCKKSNEETFQISLQNTINHLSS